MKENRLFTTICLMAAILFTACTQDELVEQGNTLPDGEYPLQIGSVTITAESSEEPWTRVTEKPDGSGSVFQGGERIGVRIAGSEETGVYIIKVDDAGNVTITPEKTVYWKSTQPAEVTAWYPAEASSVDLGFQSLNGLTYVLRGTGTGGYQSPVTLSFTHQLAKVRVKLNGAKADDVTSVSVKSRTSCTVAEGNMTAATDEGYIAMRQATYNGHTYWEANVVPDVEISDFQLSDGTKTVTCTLTAPVTPVAATLHEITITVNPAVADGATIEESGTYTMSGTYTQGVTINAADKDITLTLDGVTINTSGPGINITSGSPTIHVVGTNNSVSSSASAGIYAAENATVTITGNSREDELTVSGGSGASGIGGYILETYNTYADCGDITIQHITLTASGSNSGIQVAPGIGSAGNAACGAITIDDATVYARGGTSNFQYAPGIGCGFPDLNSPTSIPTVIIKNQSVVHTHRGGNNTDYIGWAGDMNANTPATNSCNFGTGGSATSSTIYCYTGSSTDADHIFVYDASSNRTEQ